LTIKVHAFFIWNAIQYIGVMVSGVKTLHISPTTRQISVAKIPAIFDFNHSLPGFDKPGVDE